MKTDIILAGVGGQGILSIAATLGSAALSENLYIKQAETHGMSQRGGAVISHLRIADRPIWSDLIPMGCADIILSVEPMESLRYLPYLKEKGTIVTNTTKFENVAHYPELENDFDKISRRIRTIRINADKIAHETGNHRASNMVMVGAASPFIEMNEDAIVKSIEYIFKAKGEKIISSNIAAFQAGKKFALNLL